MLALVPLSAQTASSSGNFAGRVTDKTGALIVGAQITLTNVQTGAARNAPSNASGVFNFALVTPGTYILTATKNGFATAHSLPATVQVGQTITVNFTMQPGTQTQTVEVTAQTPLVNAAQTGVSGNISTSQVQNLPINGNDYGSLAVLVPGVKPVQPYDPTKQRVATFSVDGGSGRNVNVTVDGVEDKDNTVGGPVMQLPLNAVQEFKVSPSRFSAANGRSEGASINVVEKQGTNKFHGGAQYYFTDTSLNAIDYFSEKANGGSGTTPQFDRQQFGADIGGPVRKNKDFFFFAFFRDNEKTQIPVSGLSYTELTDAKSIGADPIHVIPTPYHDNRYSVRLDHTINDANHLSGNFNWQSNYGLNDQDDSTDDGTTNNFTMNHLILGGITWNTVINPTTVNSFTAGYQYWSNYIDTKQITALAISFPNATMGIHSAVPQHSIQRKWEFRDDFSMNRGNHSLKFGEDFLWEPVLGGSIGNYDVPTIAFSDNPSVIVSNSNGLYPDGFSTPGAVTSMSLSAGTEAFNTTGGTKSLDLYSEDDWQATPRLTLNLGVRYSLDFNTYGEADQPNARGYLALKAINSPFAAKLPTTDKTAIAPIVGFTYDLTGHGTQLLRGGFGMYTGQAFVNFVFGTLSQSSPTIFSTVYNQNLSSVGAACSNCDVPGSGGIPLSSWRFGVDSGPTWTGGVPTSLSNGASSSLIDPNFRNAVSEQFNLGYTWGMTPSSALTVDYVHELGLHEERGMNINPFINAQTGARELDAAFASAGVPVLGAITDAQSANRSRYDSLDIEYQRRMTRHFSTDISYTLARSLAWGGRAADNGNSPATLDPWDPVNFGPSTTDQRHRIVFSGIFNLPWGLNVAPIMQWASAPPYSATMGSDIFGLGRGYTRSGPYAIVPNSDPTDYTAYAGVKPVFDPGTGFYTLPCLQANSCHEIGIDALRGQSFFDLDARIGKRIGLRDWGSVNLFFQAFDLTNRTNFGSYTGNVRSSSFEQPQGYISGSGVTIPKSFRGEFGAEFTF